MAETMMTQICFVVSKYQGLEEQNKKLKEALSQMVIEWANSRAEVERLKMKEKLRAESGSYEEYQDSEVFEVSTS